MRNASCTRKIVAAPAMLLVLAACAGGSGESSGVSISEPADGATVSSPVRVVMESETLTIEPAGQAREGAGHFHVMVDVGCVEAGDVIPSDESHVHFGDASTEASLELEPGEHTLCLQVGDGAHTALDATDVVTIAVEE